MEESKDQELKLSDLIHTLSPSPAPRSQVQPAPQTPVQIAPSSIPVLTLVCKRTNQPLTPPVRMHSSPEGPDALATFPAPSGPPSEPVPLPPVITPILEPPSSSPQAVANGLTDQSPFSHIAHPLLSSSASSASIPSPVFRTSEIQQAHATITHLTQQLTLLKHQRDLLTHQRDIFIAQKEEERLKHEAQEASWERLAEALISQNAKEGAAGLGRKAIEVAEKYALRVEEENRSLRQQLLNANTRLTILEKELDRLRPLLIVTVTRTRHMAHSTIADQGEARSIHDLGSPSGRVENVILTAADEVGRYRAVRSPEALLASFPPPSVPKRRRKVKPLETSQPSVPKSVEARHHKTSPLSEDARAECMLAMARTLGRRRLQTITQDDILATSAPVPIDRDGGSAEMVVAGGETVTGVAGVGILGRDTPFRPRTGERRPFTSSSKAYADSTHPPASVETGLNAISRATKAVPIVPIPTSGNPSSHAHEGDVPTASTAPITGRVRVEASAASSTLVAGPSSTATHEQRPRRRGRPKGSKNKKRVDEVDTQPAQGFHSLLSAAMTLEGGDEDLRGENSEEDISSEEPPGPRTRRQTTKAQAAVANAKSRRRSRPKDTLAAEALPSTKRRKVAASSPVPRLSSPVSQHGASPSPRESSSSERGALTTVTASHALDGITRMRSALDVLADQAIQEVRRPSTVSTPKIAQPQQGSASQSVKAPSSTGSVERDNEAAPLSPPGHTDTLPHSIPIRLADPPAKPPFDIQMMYVESNVPQSRHSLLEGAAVSPQPTIQSFSSEDNCHGPNHLEVASSPSGHQPATPSVTLLRNNEPVDNKDYLRSKSLSDRDASGEPEDPEEVDMDVVQDGTGGGL